MQYGCMSMHGINSLLRTVLLDIEHAFDYKDGYLSLWHMHSVTG